MSPTAGSRLPDATRVGRVRLAVADLERSVAFYRRVLGLRVLGEAAERGPGGANHLTLGPAASDEALLELHEEPGAAPVPRRGRLGLFHFAILLPDRPALGRFLRHLDGLGVHPGASDHLVSEALYLNDPDGLGIEVYADRPRSEWHERNGELVMATEPLDFEGVLLAGSSDTGSGGGAWDGMPAGATMGHVHLHVGDLDRASAFYHEGLGLDRTVWSYPGALFLSAGGYHHHLGVNTWAAGAPPAGEGDARLLAWELIVPTADGADAVLGRLEAAGHPVERIASGGLVRDPWGTALRVRAA